MHSSSSESPASRRQMSLREEARRIAALFDYTDHDVRRCSAAFIRQMNEGLQQKMPAMCQIPTYVTRVAHGTEKGLSLAVDLGGTNLRVCSVDLHGDTTFTVLQSRISIPSELMVTTRATELFSFIAMQIKNFLEKNHNGSLSASEEQHNYPRFSLGFTFSFPVDQNGINSGVLLRWTKGFYIPDAVGKNVCALLQDQIDHLELPVKVTALVNDAAGTIMSRAYTLPVSETRTSIGAIFGTGTNGVYLEKLSKITKAMDGLYNKSTGEMFISIEWGSFDNHLSVLPVTPYDTELNEASVNPGNQMFEKRVSGMFLGELLRIVICEMHKDPDIGLFKSQGATLSMEDGSHLYTRWAVDSSILSVAEADDSENLACLRRKMEESLCIPATRIGTEDALAVKTIAHAIGKRAARLAGMAVGSVIVQSQRLVDPVDPLTAGTQILGSTAIPSTKDGAIHATSEDVKRLNAITPEDTIDTHLDPLNPPFLIDVGVDGSVIELYPGFEMYMREALRTLDGVGRAGDRRIKIGIAKDGSSVGAAIIALLAAEGNPK